jgi:hypothetical protein
LVPPVTRPFASTVTDPQVPAGDGDRLAKSRTTSPVVGIAVILPDVPVTEDTAEVLVPEIVKVLTSAPVPWTTPEPARTIAPVVAVPAVVLILATPGLPVPAGGSTIVEAVVLTPV